MQPFRFYNDDVLSSYSIEGQPYRLCNHSDFIMMMFFLVILVSLDFNNLVFITIHPHCINKTLVFAGTVHYLLDRTYLYITYVSLWGAYL